MTRANRMQRAFFGLFAAILWTSGWPQTAAAATESVTLEVIAHFDPSGCQLPSSP